MTDSLMTSQETHKPGHYVMEGTVNGKPFTREFVAIEDYNALQGHYAALLSLAKQYARECLECGGTGRDSRYVNCTDLPLDFLCCDECSDIWAVINKAEGRADHER